MLCTKCGKEIDDNATSCDSCGQTCGVKETAGTAEIESSNLQPAPIEQSGGVKNVVEQKTATIATKKCGRCGNQMQPQVMFCDKCGLQQINFPIANTQDFVSPKTIKKHPRRKLCIVGVLLIGIITVIVAIASAGFPVDFLQVYQDIGGDTYHCKVATDNSYLQIDTNPLDIEDSNLNIAWQMIEDANLLLGFSETLTMRMVETRSMDGRQFEENDKVKVTWTYHPNKGMEVTYAKK